MRMLRFLVLSAAVLAAPAVAGAQQHPTTSSSASSAQTLKLDMRKLWTDHVVWTRDYIVAAVADQPDAQAAATRLMKNQEDIGAAVARFYGDAAGRQLTTLLKEHISIATEIVKAAKAGDKAAQQQADARWQQNAVQIATSSVKRIRTGRARRWSR